MSARTLVPVKTAVAAALSTLLWCSTALAQSRYPECDHTPSDSDVDAAKGLHKAAEQYYAKARYDRAIQSWMEAYTFDCRAHGLLINIGNAYEKLGETKKAIEAFETYLARMGDNSDPTVRDKVANLKELIQRQPPPQPPPSPTPDPRPQPQPVPKPNGNGGEDEGPGPYPWVVVGLGGAIAIGGGVLLGVGINNENTAAEACPDRRDPPNRENCPENFAQLGNEGIAMQRAGAVLLGVGGAAIVGGIVWYVLDSQSSESTQSKPSVKPVASFTPEFTGLGLIGRF
jgi:tetratricopeptide (TPR) repeat protein